MIRPDALYREIPFGASLRRYEVLAELTEMWWQAFERENELALANDDKIENRHRYLSDLAKAIGKRQTWEEAIAIYAGWNGVELDRYLGEVLAERKDGTSRA